MSDILDKPMMRLTNLADYAVVVMTTAARCESCVSASAIARTTGLSTATAAKLLNMLTKAGLLLSTRGAAGGFRLARAAETVTLADIVEAVDGPIALTSCVSPGHEPCGIDETCPTRGHWRHVNAGVRNALAAVRLDQLASSGREIA